MNFQNRFFEMGPEFYQAKTPDPVTDPYLIDYSPSAGKLIDLPTEVSSDFLDHFSGNKPLEGAQPLAMAYSGHQFGSYNPRMGDGRGLLLGEIQNQNQEMWDIHLKGAGPTRFARGFDGRATLSSSIREHLASEALSGLGGSYKQLGEYQNGGVAIAKKTNCDIVPVYHDAGKLWPKGSFVKQPGTITLVIGKPIQSTGKSASVLTKEVRDWTLAMQKFHSSL